MSKFKSVAAVALGTCLMTLSFAATSVEAGVLAPRVASDMRTLQGSNALCSGGTFLLDTVVANDGGTSAFSIPAGEVLVVIAVDWGVTGATAGNAVSAVLHISSGTGRVVWTDTATAGSNGEAGNTAPVGGVVVKSGTPLCFDITAGAARFLQVHGFLVKDK
jgi:hypothetical protein